MRLEQPLSLTLSPQGRGDFGALTRRSPCCRTLLSRRSTSPLPPGERVRERGHRTIRQNAIQTARARRLRRDQTAPERALWYMLRARRLAGLKFRRQVPLGPYIVDFYCAELRLVIEVDSGHHARSTTDAQRDAWLNAQGFNELRIWNTDILNNPTGVADAILAYSARDRP
ncbi:endonuclease domain-containing protein [uncultured Tateyamaria sp.]|uniref:endonuclease domain-containing protein n=1 Tax=uncultured Tateyamaria sp. TaxID=455651 RepID=UPI002621FCBE|nr:endonuclease domain-containing protein [uncultured Tateyamaria sp.]